MTPERYRDIELGNAMLTQEEVEEGWHHCTDWDFMLIGPDDDEMKCCTCYKEKKIET